MKNKFLIIASILLLANISWSQDTKGFIAYDVYVSSDDPSSSQWIDKMENSMLEMRFVEGKIRTDLFMGDFMTQSSISQKGQDTSLVLLDGMMGKIAMKVTEEDMDEKQKETYEVKNVELTDETKEVMGYTCKKAILTRVDDSELVVWYTDEIVPDFREGQYLYEEIPGVPLEMTSSWGKMDMKIVAYKFKAKVKKADEKFSLNVPDGFTLKTPEEMKQMRGGQ